MGTEKREIEPDFINAIGTATLCFGAVETLLIHTLWQLLHGKGQKIDGHEEDFKKCLDLSFSKKVRALFDALARHESLLEQDFRSLNDLESQFERSIKVRNFIIHGLYVPAAKPGEYLCVMIDRKGNRVDHAISAETVRNEAERVASLHRNLRKTLKAYGLIGDEIQGLGV